MTSTLKLSCLNAALCVHFAFKLACAVVLRCANCMCFFSEQSAI